MSEYCLAYCYVYIIRATEFQLLGDFLPLQFDGV